MYQSASVPQHFNPRPMTVIFFCVCGISHPHRESEGKQYFQFDKWLWSPHSWCTAFFNLHSRQVHYVHVLCIMYLSTVTPSIPLQKTFKIFIRRNKKKKPITQNGPDFTRCCPQVWSMEVCMQIITAPWCYGEASTQLFTLSQLRGDNDIHEGQGTTGCCSKSSLGLKNATTTSNVWAVWYNIFPFIFFLSIYIREIDIGAFHRPHIHTDCSTGKAPLWRLRTATQTADTLKCCTASIFTWIWHLLHRLGLRFMLS